MDYLPSFTFVVAANSGELSTPQCKLCRSACKRQSVPQCKLCRSACKRQSVPQCKLCRSVCKGQSKPQCKLCRHLRGRVYHSVNYVSLCVRGRI